MLRRRCLGLLCLLLLLPAGCAFASGTYKLEVEPIYQTDYPDTLFTWEGEDKSVATSGCGAACVAMVQQYLTPWLAKTPDELLLWAYENDRYTGDGLSSATLVEMLDACGIEGKVRYMSAKSIHIALCNNRPVIVHMKAGYFTGSGHYLLIIGIDSSDRITVIDPASPEKSAIRYSYDTIWSESAGKSPFIVCDLVESL